MSEERILFELQDVIRRTFDDDAISVKRDTTAADVDGWDSLSNVELMVALEAEFGVRFRTGEMAGLKTVGELADVIAARERRRL
jgi:acyl carrier protein